MKKCSKCKQLLDKSNFSPSSGGKYLRPECKECARKLAKERKVLRDKHGDPPADYRCPICNKAKEELAGTGGNAGIWVVDHHHESNTFRGHLCHNCNRGIGNFKDNTETLNRAIEYIHNHTKELANEYK
jgi:hypothetical protein